MGHQVRKYCVVAQPTSTSCSVALTSSVSAHEFLGLGLKGPARHPESDEDSSFPHYVPRNRTEHELYLGGGTGIHCPQHPWHVRSGGRNAAWHKRSIPTAPRPFVQCATSDYNLVYVDLMFTDAVAAAEAGMTNIRSGLPSTLGQGKIEQIVRRVSLPFKIKFSDKSQS